MKWLGRILYVVMVFFIGLFVVAISNNTKLNQYYEDKALPLLVENNREAYIEEFMTSRLVEKYIEKPVYLVESENNDYNFEFAMYHAEVNASKNDLKKYIILYFNIEDIDLENILYDYESYEKTKDNALYLAKFKIDGLDEFLNIPFEVDVNKRSAVHLLEVRKDDNNNDVFYIQYRDDDGKNQQITSDLINQIEISLLDGTKGREEDDLIEHVIATIDHNKNYTVELGKKEYLTDKNDDGTLISNNFNGKSNNFGLNDLYEDESNLGVYHKDEVNKYLSKAKNSLYWYGLIIAGITYLLFFLKPTINYFKNKKDSKQIEEQADSDEEFQGFNVDRKVLEEIEAEKEAKEEIVEEPIKDETNNLNNLDKKTVKELKEIAKEMNLTGYTQLRKAELIKLIKENK